MQCRIGIGYDIHRLERNRKLILGGVEIPFSRGLYGHSDADVLLHAICDALLGALGAGDIGEHFPDTDPAYYNISSLELLKKVYALMKKSKYGIENLDTIIIAEAPMLGPFKPQMRKKIADALGLKEANVNIKATRQEGIGFPNQAEAIAAYACVLLNKKNR